MKKVIEYVLTSIDFYVIMVILSKYFTCIHFSGGVL
jgi:hypothetical protein